MSLFDLRCVLTASMLGVLAACGGGNVSQSTTAGTTTDTTARPSYNTGNGFFVLNGKLYDANGNEFRIRGVDRSHYNSPSQPGISNSRANTVRMFMDQLSIGAANYVDVLNTQHIAYNEVPMVAMRLFPDGTSTTGNSSASELASGVAWWVSNASAFTALDKYLLVNIANEWGPSNDVAWANAYESAIASMRTAGYLGPLVIDAGGSGQDVEDLLNYSTAVFTSDPQQNIIFSLHIYGNIATADIAPDLAKLAALSSSAGMVFIIGEFGPGRDIGPSPTLTTPADIITAAEANGIGWMPWAWDDNNLSGGASNDSWFSMTYTGPGIYTQASDLTIYGQDVVLNPTYGLQVLAKSASIF
jgi:mannan endo-1,4-beta-mannosidase